MTVWLVFGFQVSNRSIYSHLRNLRAAEAGNLLGQIRKEFESNSSVSTTKKKPTRVKSKSASPLKKTTERQVQDLRVKKLRIAAKKAQATQRKKAAKTKPQSAKTKVDKRISVKDEKALDDLLTARLDRLK